MSIPWPEFYVLYNGQEPYPDDAIFCLSDLFEKPRELGLSKNVRPLLELEARVININEGRNEAIAKRCKKLAEYSAFIAKTYSYFEEFGDKEKAVNEVVKYCSKHDILREFLDVHGKEISNMLLEEWNIDDAKEVWQEEAREEGLTEGLKKGQEEVIELLSQGLSVEEIKLRLSQATNK